MSLFEVVLPYPPSVNTYKRVGRITTTKSGKKLQMRVNTETTKYFYWQVWMKCKVKGLESFGEAVISLEIDVYPPDRRKRDLDNICKPAIDSLMRAGLFDDDSQIARLLVTRKAIIDQGQIIVRISHYVT